MLIKCPLIFNASTLRNFENSFLTMYMGNRPKNNNCITKGIKFSSTRKRELYILYKNTNNIQIKHYYKNTAQSFKNSNYKSKNNTF
jgi:hypothetical protein